MGNSTSPLQGTCNDWRFEKSDTCNQYYPCSKQRDAESCYNNLEKKDGSCVWCGDSKNGNCQSKEVKCLSEILSFESYLTEKSNSESKSENVVAKRVVPKSSSSNLQIYISLIFFFLFCMF